MPSLQPRSTPSITASASQPAESCPSMPGTSARPASRSAAHRPRAAPPPTPRRARRRAASVEQSTATGVVACSEGRRDLLGRSRSGPASTSSMPPAASRLRANAGPARVGGQRAERGQERRRPARRSRRAGRPSGPGRPRTARRAGRRGSPPFGAAGRGCALHRLLVEVGELAHPGDRRAPGGHRLLPGRAHGLDALGDQPGVQRRRPRRPPPPSPGRTPSRRGPARR